MSDTNPILTSVESLQIEDSTGAIISPSTEDSSWLITQKVPDVTGAEVLTYFTFNMEGGDFATTKETANWQNITALVIDPTNSDTRSTITQTVPIKANAHFSAIEASMNQRVRHRFATMEMSTNDVVPVYTEYTISTLQQATTTLTLTMSASVLSEWSLWDWIDISGCADNRINYPNFVIATISANWLVVTGTVSDEATIPSLSVWPYSTVGMTARKRRQLLGQDGYGMRFSGTSATANAYLTKFGANITKVTGTLVGVQTITSGSTAPVFTSGATGQVDIRTTSKFYVRSDADWVAFFDNAIDSSVLKTTRTFFSWVKPWWQKLLYAKYNAISPKSMTRPIAKIVSITKTASTTATVTTDVPHGLLTTNYVTIKGVRDQTNFPVLTTPTVVASTPTTTTFTIVIWPSATATSYGWSVIMCQGWVDQPWIITQLAQSLTSDATTQLVTIVWSGTWAGLNIGEYVYLHGFRNSTNGADLGYDGAWEVVTLSTTTLIVKPVFNHLLVRVSPVFTTLGTTNCGGTVILMTTLRSHDSIMSEYSPVMNQIDWQGTWDVNKSMPVTVLNNVTSNQWTAVAISATGTGAWYIRSAIAGIADIASAAITTTTTTASIANDLGNSFQVTIPVTVVTGTTPTMDVRIEESFDWGTNWVTLYEFQRITATGSYNSPILRATGRHIRYVQTLAGTTPSFTRAITRNVLPLHNAEPQKRLFDRTINVNSLNATSTVLFGGASNNVQLVVNMWAITTTAPQFKLQWSEDNVNWFDISTALTAVASSTVQITVSTASSTFIRAIVSTTWSGATLGYLSLKAYS